MRFNKRMHRNRCKPNQWEEVDSPTLHDEARVIFGEDKYLQEYMCMGTFKELFNGVGSSSTELAVEDGDFARQFPSLHHLMCVIKDDEGKKREVCSLTIVCEDGQVKAGVNERNHHLSLWVSAGSLGGVFAALEGALSERPVAWRKAIWKGRTASR